MAEAAAAATAAAGLAAAASDGPRLVQVGEWLVLQMGDGRHFFAQAAAKGYARCWSACLPVHNRLSSQASLIE